MYYWLYIFVSHSPLGGKHLLFFCRFPPGSPGCAAAYGMYLAVAGTTGAESVEEAQF